MKKVAKSLHLTRRNGTYYYHRRVPDFAVKSLGKRVVKFSLNTHDHKVARSRAEIEDVKWSATFSSIAAGANEAEPDAPTRLATGTIDVIREYVTRSDLQSAERQRKSPPEDREQLAEMRHEAEERLAALSNPSDPQASQWIFSATRKVLTADGSAEKAAAVDSESEELIRRALLELARRHLARLSDDYGQPFFDALFGPDSPKQITFGELSDQYLHQEIEKGRVNGLSKKRTDKVAANVSLVREIVGAETPASNVNYDEVLRVQNLLARMPTNRTKLFPKLSVEAAVARAQVEEKAVLSATTQGQYLETFKGILELGTLKGQLSRNPARSVRPLKRDELAPREKRRPFSLDQIEAFFSSSFYRSCAPDAVDLYTRKDREWRFWLPLLCLFMGMRPNEACQMSVRDVKRTPKGTWFVDVVASEDEEDDDLRKTVKTSASRRRIPVHPELISLGFLRLVKNRKAGARLFPTLKPDKYGNLATYALRRFREKFLPDAIALQARQSFYSFRHSFRDALRRIDAQPATIQALGGWGQGSLVSDHYGDQFDPDYQAKFIGQVSFGELDLSFLRSEQV